MGRWGSPAHPLTARQEGAATTFQAPFLTLTYTQTGAVGGCPAEKDNDGRFTPKRGSPLCPGGGHHRPSGLLRRGLPMGLLAPGDAQGRSQNGKTLPAFPTPPKVRYPRQPMTPQAAAAIPASRCWGPTPCSFGGGE